MKMEGGCIKNKGALEKFNQKNNFFKWLYVLKYAIFCKKNSFHAVKKILYFLLKNNRFTTLLTTTYQKIKHKIRNTRHACKFLRDRPLWWQYTFSRTTFLLGVRPKNSPWHFPFFRRGKTLYKHFPPPGYGIPPGYDSFIKKHNYRPKKEYGLYLFPGRINFAFGFLTFFLSLTIFSPLIYEDGYAYEIMVVTYWLLAYWFYQFLFKKMMPASLDNVWEKWPIPAYELFLSVPHAIDIAKQDRLTTLKQPIEKDEREVTHKAEQFLSGYQKPNEHIFWRPDTKTPMWRQSTESAPNMDTLQELILNLAVFEFLFHKNDDQSIKKAESATNENNKNQKNISNRIIPQAESIREYHWYFFLFSPILINLLLILLVIFLFSILKGEVVNECTTSRIFLSLFDYGNIPVDCKTDYKLSDGFRLIMHFPYNLVLVVMAWFLFTLFYVGWVLETLTDLSKKIRQNYFNTQLDLIPQQILNELLYIPTQQQIDNGIAYVKTILNWSSSIIFLGLMAVLEIFSQSASREHIDYKVGEGLKNLLKIIIGG